MQIASLDFWENYLETMLFFKHTVKQCDDGMEEVYVMMFVVFAAADWRLTAYMKRMNDMIIFHHQFFIIHYTVNIYLCISLSFRTYSVNKLAINLRVHCCHYRLGSPANS